MRSRLSRLAYMQKIHTYIERREDYKKRAKIDLKRSEYLKKRYRELTIKISRCRRALKRLDVIHDYLTKIDKVFQDLFEVKIHLNGGARGQNSIFVKMFSKWCLEHNFIPYNIRLYMGIKINATIHNQRKSITKLIVNDPDIRIKWNILKEELILKQLHNFKQK
jgi:hypothetical protein